MSTPPAPTPTPPRSERRQALIGAVVRDLHALAIAEGLVPIRNAVAVLTLEELETYRVELAEALSASLARASKKKKP